jgi:hypothetical protein
MKAPAAEHNPHVPDIPVAAPFWWWKNNPGIFDIALLNLMLLL